MTTSSSDRFARVQQIIEICANLALLTAIIVGLAFLLHPTSTRAHSDSSTGALLMPGPNIGTKIGLPGVNWSTHKATLVVIISSNCHYCINSAGFYSQLTHLTRSTPIIVVMPQSKEVASNFLKQHGITPDRIVSADLNEISVEATPTLLLISSSGVVTQSWIGELAGIKQKQVLDALNNT